VIEIIEGVTTRIDYQNFEIGGLEDGKTASITAGPIKMQSPSPDGLVTLTVAGVEASDVSDLCKQFDGIADTILTRRHPDVHTYTYGNGDSLSNSYRYGYSYSDRYDSAYCYSLRYAAMQRWVVGGTGFPQRPSPLRGRLFLWGLGPKVLRHGRPLGRYSRKRLHTSI